MRKNTEKKVVRISKILSHSGICSRRDAEELIRKGNVEVNGNIFKEFLIDTRSLKSVKVNGKEINKRKTELWIFNKPPGFVCSNREQGNQKSMFSLLPKSIPRVVSVGRLDIDSEGLILLTNNPSLSNFLEKPINNIERKYEVKIKGVVPKKFIEIKKGITVNGIKYKSILYKFLSKNNIEIVLKEGKNREIRNILSYFNVKVEVLKRIRFGPFFLKNLGKGHIVKLENKFLKKKLQQIGFFDEGNFWPI
tara:strand:- start:2267 stop:3016 length:750 start_codon:yes stop_codon:yes gene_type:complete